MEKYMSTDSREFSEKEVARCFGSKSNSGATHELGKDPAKYERMKKQAIKDKLIPDIAASQPWTDKDYRRRFDEKPLSEEQIRIRALVSEAEVRALYVNPTVGSKENLSTLAADASPEGKEKFRRIQDAAQEYGFVAKRQTPREPEPKPVQRETLLTLPNETCDRIGLKRGSQVDEKQYLAIVSTIHQVDEERAKAKAQAERDAANDESVKSFGHVRETAEMRTWKAEQRAAIAAERALADRDAAVKKAA